jgi:hypothetical protein
VVIYLTKRTRQRRRLAAAQRAAQGFHFPQPQQPPPNPVTEPMYQTAGTPWAQPTQVLPSSSRIPSYYANNSSAANMTSWQNQQQPPPSEFSQQPSTTAHSEYNSTYGDSSDYHAQPWATAASTSRLGVNTPWTKGSNAPGSRSSEISSTGLGRQNTKARYLTATQREEVTLAGKRREVQSVGTSRVGASNTNTNTNTNTDAIAIASTAPVTTTPPINGGNAGWAADDVRPTDPTVPGGALDLPPPAYSEHQPT